MCILLLKDEGKKLDKDIYLNCYTNNADGAGFAYVKNNKLRTLKGFFSFNDFWTNFEPYEEYARIIHFRVGTSGFAAGENCHPWRVNKNLVMAHNGTIPITRTNQAWSDSGNYCEFVLKELTDAFPDWWKEKEFQWMMEAALGSNNKVVLLDNKGEAVIFNEKEGEKEDGVWFSNKSYLSKKYQCADYCAHEEYYFNRQGEVKKDAIKLNDTLDKKLQELTANIDVKKLDERLAAANKARQKLVPADSIKDTHEYNSTSGIWEPKNTDLKKEPLVKL